MKHLLVLVVLLLPAVAAAQGLGDAAARERHKRQATTTKPPSAPRVFDNDDLRAGQPPKKEGEAEPASSQPGLEPLPDDQNEQEFKQRVAAAETELAAAEGRVAAIQARVQELQDKLNPMSPSFVLGAATAGMDAPGAELRVRDELRKVEAELVEARQAVDTARAAVADVRSSRGRSGAR